MSTLGRNGRATRPRHVGRAHERVAGVTTGSTGYIAADVRRRTAAARETSRTKGRRMQRIVVAAKAGAEQPWLADAAAQLAQQTGAEIEVVSVDGLELEGLSTVPRAELAAQAKATVDAMLARLRDLGVQATGQVLPGRVVRGILVYAEEREADMIVSGASTRGPVASRLLGNVPLELVQKARRPVLIISPPR